MRGPFEDLGGRLRKMWHVDVSVRGNVLRGVIWWTLLAILALAVIDLLTEEVVELLTSPLELGEYKNAIMEAMYKGTKRHVESEDESTGGTAPKNVKVG